MFGKDVPHELFLSGQPDCKRAWAHLFASVSSFRAGRGTPGASADCRGGLLGSDPPSCCECYFFLCCCCFFFRFSRSSSRPSRVKWRKQREPCCVALPRCCGSFGFFSGAASCGSDRLKMNQFFSAPKWLCTQKLLIRLLLFYEIQFLIFN